MPLLLPLTTVSMSNVHQDLMREWARDNGKSVRQRTVSQETTKYKSWTLPLNMYRSEEQIGEKVKFDGAGADEEDLVDEYSSQSSSSDFDADIAMTLMKKLNWETRTGRFWEPLGQDETSLSIRSMACKTCDEWPWTPTVQWSTWRSIQKLQLA